MRKETMGQRLQRLRREAGLSQRGLADRAGVPIGTLRNWEQGRREPYFSTAVRVAMALGVTLDELAARADEAEAGRTGGKRKGKR
jgi:transcriptional regulator with XRE-family HTH domain